MTNNKNSNQKPLGEKKPKKLQFNPGNMAGKPVGTDERSERKPEKFQYNPGNMAGKTASINKDKSETSKNTDKSETSNAGRMQSRHVQRDKK